MEPNDQLQQTQTRSSQLKISVTPQGDFQFEGDASPQNLEALRDALAQAGYFKTKDAQEKQEVREVKKQIDSVVIVFLGCVLAGVVFITQIIVSNVVNVFHTPQPQTSSYRVEQ